jgi:hypothetical protein
MFSAVAEHVLRRVAATPIRREPFEHLYVEEVFPADIYAEMQRLRIADADYQPLNKTKRVSPMYSASRLCFFPRDVTTRLGDAERQEFWGGLFGALRRQSFRQGWFSAFGDTIKRQIQTLGLHVPGAKATVTPEVLLMRDLAAYALGPHTDSPSKLVSVLFYLAPDESAPELGTSLYRPKQAGFLCPGGPHHPREGFDLVTTLPYRPNTLLAFPKSERCFHGVEPVAAGRQRDLLLYDIRCFAER